MTTGKIRDRRVLFGVVASYTFLRLRKFNRLEAYCCEIGQLERVARGLEQVPEAPATPKALRTHLEQRLSALKCRVLGDFAEGSKARLR